MLLDLVPYGVGDVKSGVEAYRGQDLLTGESLPAWARILAAVGALPLVPSIGGYLRRAASSGRYIGSPGLTSPSQLGAFRKRLSGLAEEAPVAKEWYEESGRALAEYAGDPERADKFIDLVALYSPQRPVSTNLDDAMRALNQLEQGVPPTAGMYPNKQRIVAEKLFAGETGVLGRKQQSFAENLKYVLDPEAHPAGPVTADVWIHRAGKYTTEREAFSPKQYDFIEGEIQRLGEAFNLLPHQAQAQIWTAIKTRYENLALPALQAEARAKGLKRGTPEYSDFIDQNLQERAWSFSPQEVQAATEEAYANFAHILNRKSQSPQPEIVSTRPEEFVKIRDKSTRPDFLYPYTVEELADMQLYRVRGQDAAYALKPDGDIVNVMNTGSVPGLGKALVSDAISRGGTKLDCYDGFLSRNYYPKFGFKKVGADRWADEFAPPNWNYKKYGRPDVVYMKLEGGVQSAGTGRNVPGPEAPRNPGGKAGTSGLSGGDAGRKGGTVGKGKQGKAFGRGAVRHRRGGAVAPASSSGQRKIIKGSPPPKQRRRR